jgi:DNA-binding MarR family transcriptional regulator
MAEKDTMALQDVFDASAMRGPDNSVGFWIWRMSLAYQQRVEATLKDVDLTHLQFLILVLSGWLGFTAPPVRQSDIVAISGVKAAQVSLMIKALKAKRLITQRIGKEDTRVRVILLTPAGVEVLGKAAPLMSALQHQLWPPGPETGEFIGSIKATLQRWDEMKP